MAVSKRLRYEVLRRDDFTCRRNVRNDKMWRYFCGVCWGMIKERQSVAHGILAVSEDDESRGE